MKKVQLSPCFVSVLALLLAGCGLTTSNRGGGGITRLSIATGGTGGVYFALAIGAGALLVYPSAVTDIIGAAVMLLAVMAHQGERAQLVPTGLTSER